MKENIETKQVTKELSSMGRELTELSSLVSTLDERLSTVKNKVPYGRDCPNQFKEDKELCDLALKIREQRVIVASMIERVELTLNVLEL